MKVIFISLTLLLYPLFDILSITQKYEIRLSTINYQKPITLSTPNTFTVQVYNENGILVPEIITKTITFPNTNHVMVDNNQTISNTTIIFS